MKMLLASLCGGILMFLLGWLFYGFLLMDFFTANTTQYEGLMNEMPNLVLIFISNLGLAFLLSFIFQQWAGIKTLTGGLTAGLIIGLVLGVIYDLYILASMNLYSVTLVIVDILTNTVMTGILGAFIGWFLGTGKKKEAV